MTTQTTPEQISALREFCTNLLAESAVKSATVDDWGRFGNFTVHVVPVTAERSTTQRLKALIAKKLPSAAHLRECFSPDPVYKRNWDGKRVKTGLARNYWVFDIDFQRYEKDSNSFSLGA